MKKVFLVFMGILGMVLTNDVFAQALPTPVIPDNKVVAHRGGSREVGIPDNSLEALDYTIGLGCYASECDVYITKDDRVIVAHADREGKINGLYPWEATFEEIVSAEKLKNGETIPSLEQYLDRVIEGGSTLLWIDIKYLSFLPKEQADELARRAVDVSSVIVREKSAQNFVEFILPRLEVHEAAVKAANGDWACGLMDYRYAPEWFVQNGYDWANFQTNRVFYHDGEFRGEYSINDYLDKGVQVSVYHVDTELNREYYVGRLNEMRALTTNYPAALLQKIQEVRSKTDE